MLLAIPFWKNIMFLEIVTICFCHHFTPEHSSGENNAAEINVSASKNSTGLKSCFETVFFEKGKADRPRFAAVGSSAL